ncbi:MAG: SDR family oxidoreductase UcpA [Oscillospiraceae bacterium]|nr:SDR family oxidoreductase UcpA [Oscillospiraceae bacterium]MBR6657940.1 SDR family oxidoreductase UcpA [Oscillospiraceae bacterium]
MKLENKVAIVTGGAMGNGLGIVKVFLKYGAKVAIFDYSEKVTEVAESFKAEGFDVLGYLCDVRDSEAIKANVADVIEKFGTVDILVNNAGIAWLDTFMNTDDKLRDAHFDINIKGAWNMAKAVVPTMMEKKKGAIVNLSSVTGPLVADPGEVAYATTKAALMGFTKGLAAEMVPYGIRVNAIQPGYIMTPMVEGIAEASNSSDPESVINGIGAGIPMGRLGTIEELGELAAFLASDESSYITGQGIVIDGGSTMPETSSVGVTE